jgi:hypothetical protein
LEELNITNVKADNAAVSLCHASTSPCIVNVMDNNASASPYITSTGNDQSMTG